MDVLTIYVSMDPMTVPDKMVTVVHRYGPLNTARSGARPGADAGRSIPSA
jgi:hypothetical protein